MHGKDDQENQRLAKFVTGSHIKRSMKIKVVIVILAVACIGLLIAFFAAKKQVEDQRNADLSSINEFSNQVVGVNEHLKELGQVNLTLSNDLATAQQQLAEESSQLSNSLTALADSKSSLASAQETISGLNTRISNLEAQNRVLDEQSQSLSNRITELTGQIEDTKTKLAIALTNASFLQGELQKQLAAKAELEHKFYDLDELRAQVKKVKDAMFVARRMAMASAYDGKKGAELLMNHTPPPSSAPAPKSIYDLNVEVGSDGSVKVVPPMSSGTNAVH